MTCKQRINDFLLDLSLGLSYFMTRDTKKEDAELLKNYNSCLEQKVQAESAGFTEPKKDVNTMQNGRASKKVYSAERPGHYRKLS